MPATSPAAAVVVSGMVKRYGHLTAVDGLDLTAATGAITAILGPNGAGKTTTIECCEGLRRPDAGSVRILGLDPVADARTLRPRVGVMLQDAGLPGAVPAGQVLRHVAAMYARPRAVPGLGATLGLEAFARTQVRRLSGGQRRRLALAAAVVGRPDVTFLDEPSSGLDPQARLAVWGLIRSLRDEGTTVVLTTHQMNEAELLADHVVVVDGGRVVAAGTTEQLIGTADTVRVGVRPADDAAAPTPDHVLAARLAAALATVGSPRVTAASPGVLEVHAAPEPALLHAITGWAADRALLVEPRAARRTLEDVFLDLTGRQLR